MDGRHNCFGVSYLMRLSNESITLQRYTRMSGQGTFAKLIKPNENCLLPHIHLNWRRCFCKGYAQLAKLYDCTGQKSTWRIIPSTGDRVQKYIVLKFSENVSFLFYCKLNLMYKYDEPFFRSGAQYMRKKSIYNCTRFIDLHLNWPDWPPKQLKDARIRAKCPRVLSLYFFARNYKLSVGQTSRLKVLHI